MKLIIFILNFGIVCAFVKLQIEERSPWLEQIPPVISRYLKEKDNYELRISEICILNLVSNKSDMIDKSLVYIQTDLNCFNSYKVFTKQIEKSKNCGSILMFLEVFNLVNIIIQIET